MLTIIADALKTATRRNEWNAPPQWKEPNRRPFDQREADRIDRVRRSLHYRNLW